LSTPFIFKLDLSAESAFYFAFVNKH